MRENLTLNGTTNVILMDKGVAPTEGESFISWESLVKEYSPFNIAKIDYDGCQSTITPLVKEVTKLLIEWDGNYKNLATTLTRNGYKVKVVRTLTNLGFLYARRG